MKLNEVIKNLKEAGFSVSVKELKHADVLHLIPSADSYDSSLGGRLEKTEVALLLKNGKYIDLDVAEVAIPSNRVNVSYEAI